MMHQSTIKNNWSLSINSITLSSIIDPLKALTCTSSPLCYQLLIIYHVISAWLSSQMNPQYNHPKKIILTNLVPNYHSWRSNMLILTTWLLILVDMMAESFHFFFFLFWGKEAFIYFNWEDNYLLMYAVVLSFLCILPSFASNLRAWLIYVLMSEFLSAD